MPASEMRSSARVAPRSVTRATAVSATMSSTVAADDSTAAVHVASPIVRNRTMRLERLLALEHRHVAVDGHQHPVAAEHLAAVGEVQRRQLDLALGDEPPDVELGPVRQREHAQVLAAVVAGVVDAPQLGALVLRVPLAELVAVRDDPLLGPGPLLVAAGTAEHGVEAVLGDGVEQGHGLQRVARAAGRCPRGRGPSSIDCCTEATTSSTPKLGDRAVTELDDLVEVVAGVDVHHRERDPRRPERPVGEVEHDDGVLAAGEQQHRALALGGDLADDR